MGSITFKTVGQTDGRTDTACCEFLMVQPNSRAFMLSLKR